MQNKKITLELKKLSSVIRIWHLACAGLVVSPLAQAGPGGGVITGGEGDITVEDLATIINQETDLLSIDWESFNISEEELVKFLQPDSSSVVLNRILDSNASEIRGRIESNGHVILANPRGVLFTETATVNVGAITAAGLDMDPADFMNGDFAFKAEGGSAGVVVNRGVINAASAVLVGRQITNAPGSLISAEMVSLAAADEAVLTFDADGLIGVQVTKAVMENDLGIDTAILNRGQIDGTKVLMEASVSGDLFTAAVNNEGVVRARGIDTSGGTIRLTASGGGAVNSGTLDASGGAGGEVVLEGDSAAHSGAITVQGETASGGEVLLLGGEVTVSGSIDASGAAGGGRVLIGGGYQGRDSVVRNAQNTVVSESADINASATDNGDGGLVVVWADGYTRFAGSIRADSGLAGGNGGLVETSGKQTLSLGNDSLLVSTRAYGNGETGTWLLDPTWLTIAGDCEGLDNCFDAEVLKDSLGGGTGIRVVAGSGASGGDYDNGNTDAITVSAELIWSSGTLELIADGNIRIEDGVTLTAIPGENASTGLTINTTTADPDSPDNPGDFTLGTGASITVDNLTLDLNGQFTNRGSIDTADLHLQVGLGQDENGSTTNYLGDLSLREGGVGEILGGLGEDTFIASAPDGSATSDNSLAITGDNIFTLDGIGFSSVEVMDLALGNDTVIGVDADAEAPGQNWRVTTDGVLASGILLKSAEIFSAEGSSLEMDAALFAPDPDGGDNPYQTLRLARKEGEGELPGDPYIAYAGYQFSGLNAAGQVLDAQGQSASAALTLDASGWDQAVALTGDANSLSAAGVTFTNITDATAGIIRSADWNEELQSSRSDKLAITGVDSIILLNALGETDISFTGVSKVEADSTDALSFDAFSIAAAGQVLSLTDNQNEVSYQGALLVSGIADVTANKLVDFESETGGSALDTVFTLKADNKVDANSILFSGLESIDAGSGADTVQADAGIAQGATWNLGDGAGEASIALGETAELAFSGIDRVETLGAVVDGMENAIAEQLVFRGGVLGAQGIDFSDIAEVRAAAPEGSETRVTLATDVKGWQLTGSDGQARTGAGNDGILFSGIDQVNIDLTDGANKSAGVITGTAGSDQFVIDDENAITARKISFTGVSKVNAGDTDNHDTVNALLITVQEGGSTVDGQSGKKISGIAFSGITDFSATTIQSLDIAGSEIDWIVGEGATLEQGATITYSYNEGDAVTFTGVRNIIGSAGNDSVTGADGLNWQINGSGEATQLFGAQEDAGIDFSHIESLTAVNAEILAEYFSVETDAELSEKYVTSGDIRLNGDRFRSEDGTLVASGETVSLGDTSIAVMDGETPLWTFSGIGDVTASTLQARSAPLTFYAGESTGDLEVSTIDFHGLTKVEAGDGSSLESSQDGEQVFRVIEEIGEVKLDANGIKFSGISHITGTLEDSVEGLDGTQWVFGSDAAGDSFVSDGNFQFVNILNFDAAGATLSGPAGVSGYTLDESGEVRLALGVDNTEEYSFTQLNRVNGSGSGNHLDASAWAGGLLLTDTDYQIAAAGQGPVFSGFSSAKTASVSGTSGRDSFVFDASAKTLDAGAVREGAEAPGTTIRFTGVTDINTHEADDTALDTLQVNGSDLNFSITGKNALSFDLVEEAATTTIRMGKLDRLDYTGSGEGGRASGLTGADWQLQAAPGEVKNSGILFAGISTFSASGGTLSGTDAAETFTILNGNPPTETPATWDIEFEGMTFESLSRVNGGNGESAADTIELQSLAAVNLTGDSKAFSLLGTTFSEIEAVDNATITVSVGADTFELLQGAGNVKANDIAFSDIGQIDGLTAGDSVNGSGLEGWVLTGSANEARSNGITFGGEFSVVTDGAELTGHAEMAEFYSLGTDISVGVAWERGGDSSIVFGGLSRVAGGVEDHLDATAYTAGVKLSGASDLAINSDSASLTFSGIRNIAAFSLTGTDSPERYIVQMEDDEAGGVELTTRVNGMRFTDLEWVDTGADDCGWSCGSDDVDVVEVIEGSVERDFWNWTKWNIAFGEEGSLGEVEFRQVRRFALQETNVNSWEGDNVFRINADQSVDILDPEDEDHVETVIEGHFTIDAGTGWDKVYGTDGYDWGLLGWNSAKNNGIAFKNAEELVAINGNLTGLADAAQSETFILNADGGIEVRIGDRDWEVNSGMLFTGVGAVNAGVATSTLDASGYDDEISLPEENVLDAGGVRFTGIENASLSTLRADAGVDQVFSFNEEGALNVSGSTINFGSVGKVIGSGSGDSLDGLVTSDWTIGDNGADVTHAGILFEAVEDFRGGNGTLNGGGADSVYAENADGLSVTSTTTSGSVTRSFTDISTIHAGAGTDSFSSSESVTLTSADGNFETSTLRFTGMDNLTAAEVGTAGSGYSFNMTGGQKVAIGGLTISGVNRLDGAGATVLGRDSQGYSFQEDGAVLHDGIFFTGVTTFNGKNARLTATAADDVFTYSSVQNGEELHVRSSEETETGSVSRDWGTFTGLSSVDGNGGTDTLAAEGYNGILVLEGTSKALTNEDETLTFSGMTNVEATDLRGTAGVDTFDVSKVAGQTRVSIYDMNFTGLVSVNSNVDAGALGDAVNITEGDVSIAGNESISVFDTTFSNIEAATVTSADSGSEFNIFGTDGEDIFTFVESGGIEAHGITFDGFASVDAKGARDKITGVDGSDWYLLGEKSAENGGITFLNVEELVTVNASLLGIDDADVTENFILVSKGVVDVWGMRVSGMGQVDARAGISDLAFGEGYSATLSLNDADNQLEDGDLLFTGIDSASVSVLNTSAAADAIFVTDQNRLTIADIDFRDVTRVTDTGGSDTLSSTAAYDWTLASNGLDVEHAGIQLIGVEAFSGGNGILQGGAASSNYKITGSGALTVGDVRAFSGLSRVQAQVGDDDLVALETVTLIDSNGGFNTSDIDFTGIVSLTAADLVGTEGADKFLMEDESSLSIYGLTISGVDILNAAGGGDTVVGRASQGYQLNADGSVTHDGIGFTAVEFYEGQGAALVATSADETFTYFTGLQGEEVKVEGVATFRGLSSVDGNGGTDTLAAEDYNGVLVLEGTSKALTNEDATLTFSGMTNVKAFDLRGTAGADTFDVSQAGDLVEVSIYDMIFTGLASVDASDGNDTVKVSNGNAQITGDETISVFDIAFSDIEVGTGTGFDVSATDGNDVFSVTESGVKISGIAFDSFGTIDALGGDDKVTGADGFDWFLKGETSAENNGITFLNVEELVTVNANLQGIDDADVTENFTLVSEGAVDVWGMRVSGMGQVNARAGTSDLAFGEGYTSTLSLDGTNNQLSDGDLLFTGIDSASVSALNTATDADAISVTGENRLTVANIDFRDVSSVTDAGGSDTVSSEVINRDWVLRDNGLDVEHAGITFSAVESFSGGNGILQGGIASSSYVVSASQSVSVDGQRFFSDLAEVRAEGGDDDLAALDTVTLADGSGAFSTSGIDFTGFETLTAAGLVGTAADDEFTQLADSSLGIYGLIISGLDTLDAAAGSGDRVIGRNGIGYQLSSNGDVSHDGILFSNAELYAGDGAGLTASGADDEFTMTAADTLRLEATGQIFSGLVSANTGAGADSVGALGAVAVTGNAAATAGEIAFINVETVSGTGALSATGGADSFSIAATGELDSYGIRFKDVSSVAAGEGSDTVQGLASDGWQLYRDNKALRHAGIDFTGLDVASGGNGELTGSTADEQFTVTAANQVSAKGIQFDTVNLVDAAGGANSVVSIDGETWVLGADNRSASASGIQFANVDAVSGSALSVDAVTNNRGDAFVLEGDALTVREVEFAAVSSVSAGTDSGDTVTGLSAGEWQLGGSEGEVSTGGVSFTGMDQIFTGNALLRATAAAERFVLSGEQKVGVNGMAFEGIAEVEAGSGGDSLQGTGGADAFDLAGSGDIRVAGIRFGGLESVDAGGGGDTVNAEGASWTSVASGDALLEGAALASVNSLEILFENLERVIGAGSYAGLDVDGEYLFDSLNSATIGGVTFADLESIAAGSGKDTLYAADMDASWQLEASGGLVTSAGASLMFSSFESIFAGSGADQFTLVGGELAALDTGAGNDTVLLNGTQITSLSLGAGNDLLQVNADSSQSVALDGGSGEDEFQLRVDDKTWRIFSDDASALQLGCASCAMAGGASGGYDFSVGNFRFAGFELLENGSENLSVETDQAFDFFKGGSAGLHFTGSDMRMRYNGSGNVNIVSSGSQTIGGDAQAKRLDLTSAGDVDITTDVEVLNLQGSGDIDIVVLAEQDLVIDEINAGRNGTIHLDSANLGNLTVENRGDTHLTAHTVRLGSEPTGQPGSELRPWAVIGGAIDPLRMDVTESVNIVSVTYFQPDFINQIPEFTATGDELQSIAGAQAAQGLKSAVQNAVEDFTQVDPGIFTAVPPYSAGVEVVNAPEMALSADGLRPVYTPAGGEEEEDPEERLREEEPPAENVRAAGGR